MNSTSFKNLQFEKKSLQEKNSQLLILFFVTSSSF